MTKYSQNMDTNCIFLHYFRKNSLGRFLPPCSWFQFKRKKWNTDLHTVLYAQQLRKTAFVHWCNYLIPCIYAYTYVVQPFLILSPCKKARAISHSLSAQGGEAESRSTPVAAVGSSGSSIPMPYQTPQKHKVVWYPSYTLGAYHALTPVSGRKC